MTRQRRLGQHFLKSERMAETIVGAAEITKSDTVFELGTGLGILTPLLCARAKEVISVEADADLAKEARLRLADIGNLRLETGDGFGITYPFTIFVSNLPYSRSRDAVEWLAQTGFSHGAITVQAEFAEKLAATGADRRAVSVIAGYCFDISPVSEIGRAGFEPPPKVDSIVLKIRQKATLDKRTIQAVNRMFSYRRKTIGNMLRQFGADTKRDGRIDDLTGDEIIGIAKKIA